MSDGSLPYQYLDTGNVDDLARILIALVQETWAMRDRMAITEKLLAEHAGITAEAIDDYVADAATRGEIDRLRDRFVGKVIGAPLAAQERSVDQILERAGMARPS
jgi:hypothetical protein